MICTEVYFLLVETILRLNYHDQNFKKPFSVGAVFESNARAKLCIPCNVACPCFGIVKTTTKTVATAQRLPNLERLFHVQPLPGGTGIPLLKGG